MLVCVHKSPPTREDEMGTPYHIIVDEKTLETGIVALQDRDTTAVVSVYECNYRDLVAIAFASH